MESRQSRQMIAVGILALVAAVGCASQAAAQSVDASAAIADLDREPDLFLQRAFAPDSGLVVEPVYTGELLSNTKGGISTRGATQYQGLLDLALAADFKRLGLPLPGKFALLGQNTHGRGLTLDFVGDAQVVSNIDSFQNVMQVGEYWWEVELADGTITARVGKQDVNTEFLVLERALDFIQSSFGLSPELAVPTYPHNSAAAMITAELTESLTVRAGVWDGVPQGGNWGLSGTGITFTIGEVQYDYALRGGQLPGTVQFGAAYRSAGEVSGEWERQRSAYYVEWEQTIVREHPETDGDDQGLGAFAQLGVSPGGEDIRFPSYSGVGILVRGLLPSRDADTLGLGLARVELNTGGTGQESVVECFYKAELRPHLHIQPDLQYVASPNGVYPDALVIGARFRAAF